MANWPRAVIFDFDGVIVNSEPLHFLAFHETLKVESIELTEDEYFREMIGFDDKGAFKYILQKKTGGVDPRQFLRVMTHKKEKMMELIEDCRYQALPGSAEFIRALWRVCPLAICSGALRDEIETMLEGVSLRDCFGVIVAAEDVTKGKPDPEGYLAAMGLLSKKAKAALKPTDCLVVEDAPTVTRSVRSVGFSVLAVATSHPIEKLADANWRVPSLHPEIVQRQIPSLRMMY